MATWTTPKTNWTSSDYFNIDDYKRIVGNLVYLKELGEYIYNPFTIDDLPEVKTYTDMFYASEMNKIEGNLNTINVSTYNMDLGDSVTYYANGKTPEYTEFNRIESAQLKLYKYMNAQIDNRKRLAFVLGRKGIKI